MTTTTSMTAMTMYATAAAADRIIQSEWIWLGPNQTMIASRIYREKKIQVCKTATNGGYHSRKRITTKARHEKDTTFCDKETMKERSSKNSSSIGLIMWTIGATHVIVGLLCCLLVLRICETEQTMPSLKTSYPFVSVLRSLNRQIVANVLFHIWDFHCASISWKRTEKSCFSMLISIAVHPRRRRCRRPHRRPRHRPRRLHCFMCKHFVAKKQKRRSEKRNEEKREII